MEHGVSKDFKIVALVLQTREMGVSALLVKYTYAKPDRQHSYLNSYRNYFLHQLLKLHHDYMRYAWQ